VMARPGDTVRAGKVLALLDSPETSAALERAQTRWNRARQKLGNRPEAVTDSSRIYREHIVAAVHTLDAAKARARSSSLADLEQEHTRLAAHSAEIENLASQQLATDEEVERSERQAQEAAQAVKAEVERQARARQEVDTAESQLRVAQLEADMHAKSDEAAASREYETARRESEEADAELRSLQRRASELIVTADAGGTVISAAVSVGDHLAAGEVLFEIAELDQLRVEVPVAAKIAQHVAKGDHVMVRLPMDPPREIAATVSEILLVPDGAAQAYTIAISIPNPDPRVILTGLEGAVVFPHVQKEGFSWPKLPF